MYNLLLTKAAERDLNRLPAPIVRRLIPEIRSLTENPKPHGSRKIIGSKNSWRIRIGDYRVIYEIDEINQSILIQIVNHRKDAYR
ncbi:MAG: type II toxin-antitoxin system RelE/ParE family toxin [bacterium]|nr:type II toxin-antitoxin system RelE/ParE family toxin [bacterium]